MSESLAKAVPTTGAGQSTARKSAPIMNQGLFLVQMSNNGGSVNLEWIRHYEGSVGLGVHSLGDSGSLGFLVRDAIAFRTYRLIQLGETTPEGPSETRRAGFTLETVQRAECPPDAQCAFLLTENDVYFVRQEGSLIKRSSLQARHGDTFLDLKVAGADPRRTAVVLTQDRASTSFTVSYIEAAETLKPVWAKTWGETVSCASISSDGNYVAIGLQSGGVTLMSRGKRVVWAHSGSETSAIRSLTVDRLGNVIAIDADGVLKRHEYADGSVTWRMNAPVGDVPQRSNLPSTLLCGDSESSLVFCLANSINDFAQTSSCSYLLLNGSTGSILSEDHLASAATGASISASGRFGAISCRNGDFMLMTLVSSEKRVAAKSVALGTESATELLSQANKAYTNREFAKSISLLDKVFELDPTLYGSGSLYDDASWHLREAVMAETKTVSAETLAKVEESLAILPHDEKLTIRRNALARLLAEEMGRQAIEIVAEGKLEEGMAKIVEALKIDRSQAELRNALRSIKDQFALKLIKKADTAFHDEQYPEAIELLESILELRPGEPAIVKRLEQAKGLRTYTVGMRHYINKRYHEAAYWFRKTLAVLPDHAEAARYLTFAENFSRQPAATKPSAASSGKPDPTPVGERFGMLE